MTSPTDAELEQLIEQANEAKYHTILELWLKILGPAVEESKRPISPQWATRIVNGYPEVSFMQMDLFRMKYFTRIANLVDILEAEIGTDPECLNQTSAEEDVENNTFHYLNLLFDWQRQILAWEVEWRPDMPSAGVELAAMAEVQKMFFGQQGLTALLDQIGFQFTDDHRTALAESLEETRKELEGM